MLRYVCLVIACVGVARATLLTSVEVDLTTNEGTTTTVCSESGGANSTCPGWYSGVSAGAGYEGVGVSAFYGVPFPQSNDVLATVTAFAYFSDTLTITGDTGTGYASFSLDHDTYGALPYFSGQPVYHYGQNSYSVPFAFGVPFTITGEVNLTSEINYATSYGGFHVDSLDVYDSSWREIAPSALVVSAASGTTFTNLYGVPYASTPEPATALLIGPVLGLWWRRRGNKTQTDHRQ